MTTPNELVHTVLKNSADRIRYHTAQTTGTITMSTGSSVYFGQHDNALTLVTDPDDLDEPQSQLDHNGYQAVIKAAPDHSITLRYHCVPNKDTSQTLQIPPGCAAPLYTHGQLREATARHATHDLHRGITDVFHAKTEMDEPGINALRGRIGFSNQALYKALQAHQPQPPNAIYLMQGEQPDSPRQAAQRIDIPNN